jgi:hypothetical protein
MTIEKINQIKKQEVRVSSYGDYIALDLLDKEGKIIETPFYIKEGKSVEVHWATPSSERVFNPCDYDDFFERWIGVL